MIKVENLFSRKGFLLIAHVVYLMTSFILIFYSVTHEDAFAIKVEISISIASFINSCILYGNFNNKIIGYINVLYVITLYLILLFNIGTYTIGFNYLYFYALIYGFILASTTRYALNFLNND
jgi:uncharacterized membrane protein